MPHRAGAAQRWSEVDRQHDPGHDAQNQAVGQVCGVAAGPRPEEPAIAAAQECAGRQEAQRAAQIRRRYPAVGRGRRSAHENEQQSGGRQANRRAQEDALPRNHRTPIKTVVNLARA